MDFQIDDPSGAPEPTESRTHVVGDLSRLRHLLVRNPAADERIRSRRLVILESPYAGDVEANIAYARLAVRDSLQRGEAPLASHLLYTQPGILQDDIPEERREGIEAGLAWYSVAAACIVYADNGISSGMRDGVDRAREHGLPVTIRLLNVPSI